MPKLFGTDGVRGVAGQELTAGLAYRLGFVLAEVLAKKDEERKKIIIGKDTRISGDMLESAIASGLTAAGGDVYLAGVIPTPAVPYLVLHEKADIGVMISASHNPSEYNGIKFFNQDGYKLSDEIEDQIEALLDQCDSLPQATHGKIGRITFRPDLKDAYISMISDILSKTKGKGKKKIAFDLANGSSSATARQIFTTENTYGFETAFLSFMPDGLNINADCGSTHLSQLSRFVKENHFDAGFAFDGDADRCLAVDENGDEIDGDKIIALIADDMMKKGTLHNNTAVVTCMTNLGFHLMAKEKGMQVKSTAVGDRYVLEEMLKNGYNIGGEQSGHIILTDYATTGDGELTAAVLLGILASNPEKNASELFSCMKSLPQVLINAKVPNSVKKTIAADPDVVKAIGEAEKALNGYGRVLLRPSGTEALIRIMLEGRDTAELKKLGESIHEVIQKKVCGQQ